jgi:multiple sugar transport system substrate-binding protein
MTHLARTTTAIALTCALAITACSSSKPDASSTSSPGTGKTVNIAVWEGYTDTEGKAFADLVSQFNRTHPGIRVKTLETNNDFMLQKVLTAVRGGTPPDIAYLYGSWAPNVAKIPSVVDLTATARSPEVNWNDFWPAEQQVATVNGKIIGIPALVDNLAIVYNKSLFNKLGLATPSPEWTWDDFRNTAKALTDPQAKRVGWSIPADASEDTVWHWEAILWEADGDILTPDNSKAAFNSPQGLQATHLLRSMAVDDKSLYADTTNSKYADLFNAGKIGMLMTGPWDLAGFTVPYGVQVMPSFAGSAAGHQSIAGPDNWVVFDRGNDRKQAAITFLTWLTAPAQARQFSLQTGDLPIRQSLANDTAFVGQMDKALPGVQAFIDNLANVKKARPQVEAYPKISQALGDAIVAVLLNKRTPEEALNQAAAATDQALSGG